jgi:hypothetical protein
MEKYQIIPLELSDQTAPHITGHTSSVTLWYSDFKDFPWLSANLNRYQDALKTVVYHRNFVTVVGEDTIINALYGERGNV